MATTIEGAQYDALAPAYDLLTAGLRLRPLDRRAAALGGRARPPRAPRARCGVRDRQELRPAARGRLRRRRVRRVARHARRRGDAGAGPARGPAPRHAGPAGARQLRPHHLHRRRAQPPAQRAGRARRAGIDGAQPRARRAARLRREHARDLSQRLRQRRRSSTSTTTCSRGAAWPTRDVAGRRRRGAAGRRLRPAARTRRSGGAPRAGTASATTPSLSIEQLAREAGLEIVDRRGQSPGVVLDPEIDEQRHTKALFLARKEGP